jgi:mannose-6-phosphate isomerase-like protein (cupin superfamily)
MSKTTLAIVIFTFLAFMLSPLAVAQTAPAAPIQTGNDPNYGGGRNSFAGPSLIKYVAGRDSDDRRIDMFIGDWHESMPRHADGSLVLRDILTKGDNLGPTQKAAILQYTNFLAYATLAARASTTPSRLNNQQEVYYILGGAGKLTAGGAVADLHKGVAVLMPPSLEFTMRNTGDQPLTMYVINEPTTRAGFRPNDKMLVIDEKEAHVRTPSGSDPYIVPGASGHWGHVVRELFAPRDGLANLRSVLTVELTPLSLGEPHPHRPGAEEIWTSVEGDSLAWMSAELRLQHPGMAYMIRPDTTSTHTNINFGDTTIKFLYSVSSPPPERPAVVAPR